MTRRARSALGALLVAALAAAGTASIAPARASDSTTCHFGGPAGTAKVVRLDLSETGSEFVNISFSGARAMRPASGRESWHLARGLFVIDESTGVVVAHRISHTGSNPRRSVVEADGRRTVVDVPGPDTPFAHSSLELPSGLPAARYLVVGFASDGDRALPNDGYGGAVEVSGQHRCELAGVAEIVDLDHTDFSGGTQVSTPVASLLDDVALERDLDADLVVGLLDASVQIGGEIELVHAAPANSTTVDDSIVPFVSPGGRFSWAASAHGIAPLISIAGVAIDLT